MTDRTITIDGSTWTVSLAGRVTTYTMDEFALVFERRNEAGRRERRVSRFSPLGSRGRAQALAELSDADLRTYYAQSQPEWTSPELGYAGS